MPRPIGVIDLFITHDKYCYNFVVPAKAGTQAIFNHPRSGTTLGFVGNAKLYANWIPASAGMTTTSNEYAVIKQFYKQRPHNLWKSR